MKICLFRNAKFKKDLAELFVFDIKNKYMVYKKL